MRPARPQPVRRPSRHLRAATDRPRDRRHRTELERRRAICLQPAGNRTCGARIGRLDAERDTEARQARMRSTPMSAPSVYQAAVASVRLYPILSLTLPYPPSAATAIQQGETYSVSLTYGADQSALDILDADQIAVADGLAVATSEAGRQLKPQVGRPLFRQFPRRRGDDDRVGGAGVPVRGARRRFRAHHSTAPWCSAR